MPSEPRFEDPDRHREPPLAGPRLSPGLLGFDGDEATGWIKETGGSRFVFRPLRTLGDLVPLERLQLDVFGVGERDVIPASELVVVAETGGEVIGAFLAVGKEDDLAGALVGWGGFVSGVPRVVSDVLAVRGDFRDLGVGAALKKLQAAIASRRGFREIVWTVDPLRAANARLNVAKLGATAHRYERNRYGEGFGAELYGQMPTDRLHMVWDLESERTRDRLTRGGVSTADFDSLPPFSPGLQARSAAVEIPTDIDALLRDDPDAALTWRFAVRSALEGAFCEGWEIQGFGTSESRAAYILSPPEQSSSDGPA